MKRMMHHGKASACLLRCIFFMYVGPTWVNYIMVFGGDKGFCDDLGRYLLKETLPRY
jgi:hypothetical protein